MDASSNQELSDNMETLLQIEKSVYDKNGWMTIWKSVIYHSGEFVSTEYNDGKVLSEIRGVLKDALVKQIVETQSENPGAFLRSNGSFLYRFSIDNTKIQHPQVIIDLVDEGVLGK